MSKDYLKIYRAVDERDVRRESERTKAMQEAGLYPDKFTFPLTVQMELTSHCNLYCRHCYNKSGEANSNTDAMTPEKWADFARYLVSHGGIFECIISGGEPLLLGNKLFDIMDILHDDGTCFLLITNGWLLDEEKVKRLSKYRYRWLQVSIDGSDPAYHDWFRQREGSWQRAVDGAFMVSAAGIPLTIAHSVTPGSLEKVDEMCDLAYSLGAASIILGEVNLSGRTDDNREILLNKEQKTYLCERYEYNMQRYSGKMLVRRSASTRIGLSRYCNTPNHGLIARPNGDLRLDCMAPFVIGNITEGDFRTMWMEKGINAWDDPRVREYVDSFDENDVSSVIGNYIDCDVRL